MTTKPSWTKDPDTGADVMPDHWKDFLDWLLQGAERQPQHQYEYATEHGLHERSLRRWKQDPRFVKEWDRRTTELNVHPERTQGVVDALWARATQGDVKAAGLYLQYIDKFTPKRKIVVDDDRDAAGLSDSELADALESEIRHLRVVEDIG